MLIDPRTTKTLHDSRRSDLLAHGPRRRGQGTRAALANLLVTLAGRLEPATPALRPRAGPESPARIEADRLAA